jgi:hypothetical protein
MLPINSIILLFLIHHTHDLREVLAWVGKEALAVVVKNSLISSARLLRAVTLAGNHRQAFFSFKEFLDFVLKYFLFLKSQFEDILFASIPSLK